MRWLSPVFFWGGALNVRAREINEEMKLAASSALAGLISDEQLNEEYILPSIFDKRVVLAVSKAVEEAAYKTKVAQKKSFDHEKTEKELF